MDKTVIYASCVFLLAYVVFVFTQLKLDTFISVKLTEQS